MIGFGGRGALVARQPWPQSRVCTVPRCRNCDRRSWAAMALDFGSAAPIDFCTGRPQRVGFEELSILVSCFNEERTIEPCLQALREAAPGAEIVVIHGGRDGTYDVARSWAQHDAL